MRPSVFKALDEYNRKQADFAAWCKRRQIATDGWITLSNRNGAGDKVGGARVLLDDDGAIVYGLGGGHAGKKLGDALTDIKRDAAAQRGQGSLFRGFKSQAQKERRAKTAEERQARRDTAKQAAESYQKGIKDLNESALRAERERLNKDLFKVEQTLRSGIGTRNDYDSDTESRNGIKEVQAAAEKKAVLERQKKMLDRQIEQRQQEARARREQEQAKREQERARIEQERQKAQEQRQRRREKDAERRAEKRKQEAAQKRETELKQIAKNPEKQLRTIAVQERILKENQDFVSNADRFRQQIAAGGLVPRTFDYNEHYPDQGGVKANMELFDRVLTRCRDDSARYPEIIARSRADLAEARFKYGNGEEADVPF